MKGIRIKRYVLGHMYTNCYLIINEAAGQLAVADPAACPGDILKYVKDRGYEPVAILLTHGHFDHITGIAGWESAYDIPVYAHEDEAALLADTSLNMSETFGRPVTYDKACLLKDREIINIAGIRIVVIHTPGHTAGSCCYYLEDERALISGDTLFYRSVGRTDFPTGDEGKLFGSIRGRLFTLPDEVTVYPGHGDMTTIGEEKAWMS